MIGIALHNTVASTTAYDPTCGSGSLLLEQRQSELKCEVKESNAALDKMAYEKYPQLGVEEIKSLVIDDKWLVALEVLVESELERVSQRLTTRICELAGRYEKSLAELENEVRVLAERVGGHLRRIVGMYRVGVDI